MPTWDEWIKAGYWDPNKNDGEGGYWRYPNGSDTESRPGLPSEGGERNSGKDFIIFPVAVASYPDVVSPLGMYDMAGGYREATESIVREHAPGERFGGGTTFYHTSYENPQSRDIIGYGVSISAHTSAAYGLRVGAPGSFHPVDLNQDHRVSFFDVSLFIQWFVDGDERADLRLDGQFDIDDVRVFLGLMDL